MKRGNNSEAINGWLGQFKASDQQNADELLKALRFVSHDEFTTELRKLIPEVAKSGPSPVGLYVERELRSRNEIPQALFKESAKKPKRAYGAAFWPVQPLRAYDPKVGSEGIVAHLGSQLASQFPDLLFFHPSAYKCRQKGIRRFFLLTDFIGSGSRIDACLTSAWRVHSIRSWHSYKLLRLEVIAFSGTEAGCELIRQHPSAPQVRIALPCPTIASEFSAERAEEIRTLCTAYDPLDHDPVESLGYMGSEALIAFDHGVPNNVPRLLHRKAHGWTPLFLKKVTSDLRGQFNRRSDLEKLVERLHKLRQLKLAESPWLSRVPAEKQLLLLFLASLSRRPRFDETISRRTGLLIPEVRTFMALASSLGWIDEKRRLTAEGHRQLEHARRWHGDKTKVLAEPRQPYYPQTLRAPK